MVALLSRGRHPRRSPTLFAHGPSPQGTEVLWGLPRHLGLLRHHLLQPAGRSENPAFDGQICTPDPKDNTLRTVLYPGWAAGRLGGWVAGSICRFTCTLVCMLQSSRYSSKTCRDSLGQMGIERFCPTSGCSCKVSWWPRALAARSASSAKAEGTVLQGKLSERCACLSVWVCGSVVGLMGDPFAGLRGAVARRFLVGGRAEGVHASFACHGAMSAFWHHGITFEREPKNKTD